MNRKSHASRVTAGSAGWRVALGLGVSTLVVYLGSTAAAADLTAVKVTAKKPRSISISGSTYADVNQNGLYDRGDRPLPNVRVTVRIQVYNSKSGEYRWVLAGSKRTNAKGQYSFSNIRRSDWETHISAEVGGGHVTTQSGGTQVWKPEAKRYVDRPLFGSEPRVDRTANKWRTASPPWDFNGTVRRVNFGKLVAPLRGDYAKLTDEEATFLLDLNEYRRINGASPVIPVACAFDRKGGVNNACSTPDGGHFNGTAWMTDAVWVGGVVTPEAGLFLSYSKEGLTKTLLGSSTRYAGVHFNPKGGKLQLRYSSGMK